jgi:hypothetical protein
MHRFKRILNRGASWAAILQLLVVGCGPSRSGPSEGVTLYEHPNFDGDSRTFDGDFNDFRDLRGPCSRFFDSPDQEGDWDDCVSSIQLSPGWEATVYEHENYLGESLDVTSSIRDLDDVRGPCGNDWDDCISSIRVRRP